MAPTCSSCVHHHGNPTVEQRRQCRAQPPAHGREIHNHGGHPVLLAIWPLTLPTDHCGGHRPAAATLAFPPAVAKPEPGPEPVPVVASEPEPEPAPAPAPKGKKKGETP